LDGCGFPADPSAACVDPMALVEVVHEKSKQAGKWGLGFGKL